MTITEMFKGLSQEQIQGVFSEYGLVMPDNKFNFSNINIVIGTNGAGKTRFLKAIKELHLKSGERPIYGYFPALSNETKTASRYGDGEEPEVSLYEFNNYDYVSFDDFLKEIEKQGYRYLGCLLNSYGRIARERDEAALRNFDVSFNKLTGYHIRTEEHCIYLINKEKEYSLEKYIKTSSPGQLMLLYMAVFVSLQIGKKNRILILDEPEGHLHPSALIEFLDLIKESDCFSQLWIATHSIFTVPKFSFENIVYIENGIVIKRNSYLYKNILIKMLGINHSEYMCFISNLQQWQYYCYILECFSSPEVIDTVDPEDEQLKMFVRFLKEHNTLSVLDFGGGSARLGQNLMISDFERKESIEYEVYDLSFKDEDIENLGNKGITAHKSLPSKKFDCVVMMNVLHEIEPNKWIQTFHDIYESLKDEGYFVLVEVNELTKGELPDDTGYLVLGSEEVNILFNSQYRFTNLNIKREKQKSIGIVIPKNDLNKISNKSILNAITALKNRSYSNILLERNKLIQEVKNNGETFNNEKDFNFSGRRYAYYMQQYINAKIVLEDNLIKLPDNEDSTTFINDVVLIGDKLFYCKTLAKVLLSFLNDSSYIVSSGGAFETCNLIRIKLKNFISSNCEKSICDFDKIEKRYTIFKNTGYKEMAAICCLVLIAVGRSFDDSLSILKHLPPNLKTAIRDCESAGKVIEMQKMFNAF